MEDASHQAKKLWEEVTRVYNVRSAEKEMDQIPSKMPQLLEHPRHQGDIGRALGCQAGHGDAKSGKAGSLRAPAPGRWFMLRLQLWSTEQVLSPVSRQRQGAVSSAASELAVPECCGSVGRTGQGAGV